MNKMTITVVGVPMVKNNLTFIGDQILGVNDLSFVKVLFMLEMETCFISGNLLARASSLLSMRLYIFRACIRLKLSFFKYVLLKSKLDLGDSFMGSTFSLLLDGSTKVIAFASQPLVGKLYHMGNEILFIN